MISAYDYFRVVDKMRFKSKNDKSVIIYNGNITIGNIPAKVYEYIVNGKSAIEWIVERYCVSQDKKSLIKNDANDWAREHGKPRYILDLLLSVINVSVQTVDIVNSLPKLKFDWLSFIAIIVIDIRTRMHDWNEYLLDPSYSCSFQYNKLFVFVY